MSKITEISCPAETCKFRAPLGNCNAPKVKLEFCDDNDTFNCLTYQQEMINIAPLTAMYYLEERTGKRVKKIKPFLGV